MLYLFLLLFLSSLQVGLDGACGGLIKVSPEVSEALSCGRAVVALESTIISHGNGSFVLCPFLAV